MIYLFYVGLLGLIVLRVIHFRVDGFEIMMVFLVVLVLRGLPNLMMMIMIMMMMMVMI